MIKITNKSSRQRTETPKEPSIPVYDKQVKPLKLSQEFYGKTEANPFTINPYLPPSILTPLQRGYAYRLSHKNFEYDFAETNRIIDTESLVATIFRKKKALILSEEPKLKSKNSKNADYVQKRLSEMEYVSGIAFDDLLEAIVESLVNYNNVFLLKHRRQFSSSGLSVEGKEPLAAIYVLSPTRLKPVSDQQGELMGYTYSSLNKHTPPSYFDKEDVYHIFSDKKIDLTIGTPPLEAVKDDILSLRQIEESIERTIYKNASPLLHVKVGTDDLPAGRLPNGESEVEYYNNLIQHMEDDGGVTTSHRVNIQMLGAESLAMRLDSSVSYFKARVLSGLKASSLDIGVADSISTAGANAVSLVLKQDVTAYQRIIEKFFTKKLFNDILLESNWYKDKIRVPKDDEVEFKLFDIDPETKIKVESHLANLVRYGLVSPEEFAKETGRPLPPNTLTPSEISANISTGAFSAITSPQNQHTVDAEFEVLDSILSGDGDKVLPKLYFFISDNLQDVVKDDTMVEDIATNLYTIVKKYKELGVDDSTISKVIYEVLQKLIVENLLKE